MRKSMVGYERRTPHRAALLGVIVGELHALARDAADVVAPDHDDVELFLLGPPFDSRPIAHSLMASHVIPLGPHAATGSRLMSIIILAYRPNSPFSVFKGSDSDGVSFCFGSSMAPLS